MKTIIIPVPEGSELEEFDVKMMLAALLYEKGKLSAGQAAQIVGLSKRAFLEILGKYGVSIFGYSPDDLENDLANAKRSRS